MKNKHITTILLLALVTFTGTACGTSTKRTLTNTGNNHPEVIVSDMQMTIHPDDHKATRKNADKVFDHWLDTRNMKRSVTGKRLMAIIPKSDGCQLVYDFRLIDGAQQRVTIKVINYKHEYRKQHHKQH